MDHQDVIDRIRGGVGKITSALTDRPRGAVSKLLAAHALKAINNSAACADWLRFLTRVGGMSATSIARVARANAEDAIDALRLFTLDYAADAADPRREWFATLANAMDALRAPLSEVIALQTAG